MYILIDKARRGSRLTVIYILAALINIVTCIDAYY